MSEVPHSGDVYARIGKLETSVSRLETSLQAVNDSVGHVGRVVDKLADRIGQSGRPNYGLIIAAASLIFAIGGAILTAVVLPLKVTDSVYEKEIDEIRAQVKSDHDYLIRLQEREAICREMGK
jgi:hypothetical protein